jgi:putative aminopeptidase FrvX
MKSVVEELKHLTSIPSLSGMEDNMIREMTGRLKPLADEVEIDRLGNVIATFKGKSENEPSMLVFAHMDELGLMIKKIEKNGFLRFDRIGGVPEKTLMGQFLDIHTIDGKGQELGFVGTYAHHLTPPEFKHTVPTTDQLYIDMGAEPMKKSERRASKLEALSLTTITSNKLVNTWSPANR